MNKEELKTKLDNLQVTIYSTPQQDRQIKKMLRKILDKFEIKDVGLLRELIYSGNLKEAINQARTDSNKKLQESMFLKNFAAAMEQNILFEGNENYGKQKADTGRSVDSSPEEDSA